MAEEKRLDEQPEEPIEAPADELWEDDWIGEIGDKVKAFRDEMADVAREADESMIDGPLGKVVVFLKRYWAVLLIAAVLPLCRWGYNQYLHGGSFPVNPQVISEAEFREIIDGIAYLEMDGGYFEQHPVVEWRQSLQYDWKTLRLLDLDGDGKGDTEVYVYATHGYKEYGYKLNADGEMQYYEVLVEPTELMTSSYVERAAFWDVLTGQSEWGVAEKGAGMFDHTGGVYIAVVDPKNDDHGELRETVEALLAAIRQAKADEAAGVIPPVEHGPVPMEEFQTVLESMQQVLDLLMQEND